MPLRIGIPRALLAYYYLPLWEEFFVQLGAEVIISPKTNKELLDGGVELAVDETCLPVKVFMGHVDYLKSRADVLFIPRIVSVEPQKYTCPKLLGLPDMVKSNIANLPVIWGDTVNLSAKRRDLLPVVYRIGRRISPNVVRITQAFWRACRQLRKYECLLRRGNRVEEAYNKLRHRECAPGFWSGLFSPGPAARSNGPSAQVSRPAGSGAPPITVAVVGHAYNIHDTYLSLDIISCLRKMGVNVLTSEMMRRDDITRAVSHLPKQLFWTFCQRIMGTACHYLNNCQQAVDGIINIAAFGCGPDSLVGEMLAKETRRRGQMPFMLLTIDEHTGEAGLLTRIEAFIDMIRWRRQRNACDLSPYGGLGSNI